MLEHMRLGRVYIVLAAGMVKEPTCLVLKLYPESMALT